MSKWRCYSCENRFNPASDYYPRCPKCDSYDCMPANEEEAIGMRPE